MQQAANIVNGNLQGADAAFRGVSIDSRTLQSGELFVALKGPNFDGAKFIATAAQQGAAGAISESEAATSLPTIVVDDSHAALTRLACDWRSRMSATVIGVTGSNGKTTLKELINACLSPVARTLATAGNLNNAIGLPLMMLRMTPEHRFAIFEMGANHAGEIAHLASLAEPHIVVISNAGPAHLEGFGSVDGVARAKGEILQCAPRPKVAVLNADDKYFAQWCALAAESEVLSFGASPDATVRVENIRATASGTAFELILPAARIDVALPLAGSHNALNAAAAAAVALAAGLDARKIKRGLESVQPVAGRLRRLAGANGAQLFDDSYNANPGSVIAAAYFVAAQPGDAVFVLGEMGELGASGAEIHEQVGKDIRAAGVSRLFATGGLAQHAANGFGNGAEWFASSEELISALSSELRPGLNVLVKGSRSMRMERVVTALRAPDRAGEG